MEDDPHSLQERAAASAQRGLAPVVAHLAVPWSNGGDGEGPEGPFGAERKEPKAVHTEAFGGLRVKQRSVSSSSSTTRWKGCRTASGDPIYKPRVGTPSFLNLLG